MPYKLDIKKLRTDAGITQQQFAYRLGMSQSQVSKLENSAKIDSDLLMRISEALMASPNELLNYSSHYSSTITVDHKGHLLFLYLQQLSAYLSQNCPTIPSGGGFPELAMLEASIHTLSRQAYLIGRRPRIAILGNYSTGKSTLANTLLGENIIEQAIQASTSCCIYILHTSERPPYMQGSDVWVFHKDENGLAWDDSLLPDQKKTMQMCIASGSQELLQRHCTLQGSGHGSEASAALVFSDAALLKSCALIDSPGLNGIHFTSEERLATTSLAQADIILFLSSSTDCLSGHEAAILQFILSAKMQNSHPGTLAAPFRSLYILSSRADLLSLDELQQKKEHDLDCCENTFLEELSLSREDIEPRFFNFSASNETLREPFEQDLKELLEEWPVYAQNRLASYLEATICNLKKSIQGYQGSLNGKEGPSGYVAADLQKSEPQWELFCQAQWMELEESLNALARRSEEECLAAYTACMDKETITGLLKERFHHGRKKQDIQNLYTYIFTQINLKFEEIMHAYQEQADNAISNTLKQIQAYGSQQKSPAFQANAPEGVNPYLISPSILAASVAAGELFPLFSFSAASSIFMPAVLTIGAAISKFILTYTITSIGREKWLAKQFIDTCASHKVWESCQEQIQLYWENVIRAVKDLKELAEGHSQQPPKASGIPLGYQGQLSASLQAFEEFLDHIPKL